MWMKPDTTHWMLIKSLRLLKTQLIYEWLLNMFNMESEASQDFRAQLNALQILWADNNLSKNGPGSYSTHWNSPPWIMHTGHKKLRWRHKISWEPCFSVKNIWSLAQYFHLLGRFPTICALVYWTRHLKEIIISLIDFLVVRKGICLWTCAPWFIFWLLDLLWLNRV